MSDPIWDAADEADVTVGARRAVVVVARWTVMWRVVTVRARCREATVCPIARRGECAAATMRAWSSDGVVAKATGTVDRWDAGPPPTNAEAATTPTTKTIDAARFT